MPGLAVAVVLVALGACGSSADAGPAPGSGDATSTPSARADGPASVPAAVTAPATEPMAAAPAGASQAVAAADPGAPAAATGTGVGDPGASPVAGLDPLALRSVVEAPLGSAAERTRGPVAESVTLPDGRAAWRIVIPGPFPARSAQGVISVGEVVVGRALATVDLGALVAITLTGDGLVAGAEVRLRWGDEAPVSVGALAVAR